ncbi:uncharacterized protein A1O5_00210 [Cladophialophora psammophila CBS 110553]|uniref:Uncharacterized protein n=1 Tax=Cladophialophora psammophila CBS 110553 TaxID=1182543 RepID=W9X634_9EURO|nr:uncharacterized protein A1O5_00210 [Cladophialophora psammophila CBS 110553]EXJ75703.1 hypothetical protein A1O5_00210 [Cladophialophora psammophila CBS 110553]
MQAALVYVNINVYLEDLLENDVRLRKWPADVQSERNRTISGKANGMYGLLLAPQILVAIQEQEAQSIRLFDPILDLEDPIIELARFLVQDLLLSGRCFLRSFFSTNAGYTLMAEISLIYTLHAGHEALPRSGPQTADGKRIARSDLNLMHATDTDLRRESSRCDQQGSYACAWWYRHVVALPESGLSQGIIYMSVYLFENTNNVREQWLRLHNPNPFSWCLYAWIRGMISATEFRIEDGVSSPIFWAAVTGLLPVVESLIQRGKDVNQFSRGWRDIELAGEENLADHGQVVRLLLSHGLDEYQSLSYAYDGAYAELLDLLLGAGVSPNSPNKWGDTLLHRALLDNAPVQFDTLMKHGAEIATPDCYGRSCFDYCLGYPAGKLQGFKISPVDHSSTRIDVQKQRLRHTVMFSIETALEGGLGENHVALNRLGHSVLHT